MHHFNVDYSEPEEKKFVFTDLLNSDDLFIKYMQHTSNWSPIKLCTHFRQV